MARRISGLLKGARLPCQRFTYPRMTRFLDIESRCRLVQDQDQDQDRSVAQEGPRDRQLLLLALRKRGAGFTDHRVVPCGSDAINPDRDPLPQMARANRTEACRPAVDQP
jgi:hypothetical protein